MNWETMLHEINLAVPDKGRVKRALDEVLSTVVDNGLAADGETHAFTARYKHTVTFVADGDDVRVRCTCQDFSTRQQALGLACKHVVAVAMWLADRELHPADLLSDGESVAVADSVWPTSALVAQVGRTIGALAEQIGMYLMDGQCPLLIGPTGVGKTSAVHQVAAALDLGLEEMVGSDAWTEADLIGTWTPAREWVWGPLGRAFRRAREGEAVLVFVDEVTRFNPRAMDLLLRAIQPVSESLARRMGVAVPTGVGEVFVSEAPLLGHRDWAPATHLTWVAAGNPGVNPLDPALVRRLLVLEAELDREVLSALPVEVGELVTMFWDSYEQGELPLPLEYQALTRARSANELFNTYRARLRALDPIAAEAVVRLLAGNSIELTMEVAA